MSRSVLPLALLCLPAVSLGADLPKVTKVERQPLAQQAKRVADTLERLGEPLSEKDRKAILAAAKVQNADEAVAEIQSILDRRCLAGVTLGKDGTKRTLKVAAGPAKPNLVEHGWRVFLVKVYNPSGIKGFILDASSPNSAPLTKRSTGSPDPKDGTVGDSKNLFLEVATFNGLPLVETLSGLELEYRVVQVYCRDSGRKQSSLNFHLIKGKARKPDFTSDSLKVAFDVAPSVKVTLKVKDHDGKSKRDGKPVMAAFTFTDAQGRVYPAQSRRLAPDFNFHPQIYRADGETVLLPAGTYSVTWTRGPEYIINRAKVKIPDGKTHTLSFALARWIHLAEKGWWSGDHHIHAAGCAHYESPTKGVTPEDMMRHIEGEDLNVGCCLSWGPCWYHQKSFFTGKSHRLSTPRHILRYDVEVSGFPSSHSGHICLLRLRDQDYPKTKLINDWPSWDMPIFKWAKSQNAVVGFAHTGWGLNVGATKDLPNYIVPPMNSIGANEYLVDIAHNMCDFLSTVDTPAIWELNIWYHTLNCGFRPRISGETDFPCIFGERVGIGRSYVQLGKTLDFDKWVDGIRDGRCYVSDGKSHLIDFSVDGLGVGVKKSELKLKKAGMVEVKATVAGLLEEKITPATEKIRQAPWDGRPYWDLERARIGKTRKVLVEVVVNGLAVAKKEVEANGKEHAVSFKVPIKVSSWVTLRILGSSHTNPVFVLVDGKPIRASKKSAKWCIDGIAKCWEQKEKNIRKDERAAAKKAYEQATAIYKKILAECPE